MNGLFGDIAVATDLRFEELWRHGKFRKLGKQEAHRYFRDTIKTEEDWAEILNASANYATYIQDNPWYTPVWGERWFRPKRGIPYWKRFVKVESPHGAFARFVK